MQASAEPPDGGVGESEAAGERRLALFWVILADDDRAVGAVIASASESMEPRAPIG
jgi:hypothetical protein